MFSLPKLEMQKHQMLPPSYGRKCKRNYKIMDKWVAGRCRKRNSTRVVWAKSIDRQLWRCCQNCKRERRKSKVTLTFFFLNIKNVNRLIISFFKGEKKLTLRKNELVRFRDEIEEAWYQELKKIVFPVKSILFRVESKNKVKIRFMSFISKKRQWNVRFHER